MKKLFILITFCTNILLGTTNLKERIDKIVNTIPNSTKISIYIYDISTGKSIYERNINSSMIPASNTKLFTTGAALKIMGPNHEISTKIFTDSNSPIDSIISGNLYIKGFGDPTFNTKDLDSIVTMIKTAGIKGINGDIIGDDTYFDKLYTRDDWIIDERANVKLPPVSALVINKNQFVIKLDATGKVGSKLRYSIKPECSFIDVNVAAKVTKFRSRPIIKSSFENGKIRVKVSGGLRKRRSLRTYVVNITNPPLYMALLLKEKLQKEGIKINGDVSTGESPQSRIELASIGVRVDSLISLVNKNSNNYLAECLFKSLGAFYSGEEGNSFYATQAVLSSFEDDFIIDEETAVVDGSGISRFNTITTGSIVRLLTKLYNDASLYEYYYKSLAISGVDGTLEDRFVNRFVRGNFHGKTGTLNGVTALSGYLTTKNNHTLAISIIMEYRRRGSRFHKEIEDKLLIEVSK